MKTAPTMFITIPTLAISAIFIRPLPKIIAFGGVATGIIKAQDAESVAGIIRKSGFIFMAKERAAKIGRIIWVVAVLDVSSVKKVKTYADKKNDDDGMHTGQPREFIPPINVERPVT